VSFNVSDALSNTPTSTRRRKLADALLDELLSWNPREFITAFRRWHRHSVSLIHLNVLTLLDEDGPDSMSHLADALEVSVASMTGIVDRMEKRGLVERRHDGGDRRVVLVHPTDAGRHVFVAIDRRRREGLTKLLERLTEEDLAALLQGHRALRAARAAVAGPAGLGKATKGPGEIEPAPVAPTTVNPPSEPDR
jgi:DNA-binding MarR family transcriptional regulator